VQCGGYLFSKASGLSLRRRVVMLAYIQRTHWQQGVYVVTGGDE